MLVQDILADIQNVATVNQITLDSMLSSALGEMSMANWPAAQKVLASRLEQAGQLGNQRLNLFLLSISAASGGYNEVASQLWSQAQQAPLDADTLRYFDLQFAPNDPRQSMLIDLERAWWDFNNWNQPSTPSSLKMETSDEVVDWEFVIQATLDGDDGALEERYGRYFDDHSPSGFFLWNLLALAYLQAGNVRTYEEMVQNSPPPSSAVPPELQQALTSRRLTSALQAFQSGQWLNTAALSAGNEIEETGYVPDQVLTETEWATRMADAFASIELGQYLQAAREFQEINFRTQEPKRLLLSRNALSLAFFKQGDYTQCENVYEEFRNLLSQSPISPDSELARQYKRWLEAVDAVPEDGQPFFSPFGGNRSNWNTPSTEELDFWQEFDSCVSLLGEKNHVLAVGKLQRIEVNLGPHLDPLQAYLTSVMFLAAFVMAGDHSEVQEMTPQVTALEAQAVFPAERTEEVSDMLRWAGFESLSRRLAGGPSARTTPLNPWEDLVLS